MDLASVGSATPPPASVALAPVILRVNGLGKCYHLYDRPADRLKQFFHRRRRYFREFWALRGVSFELHRGESCGVLGRNGSGKSTLLQLLCGTLEPNEGGVIAAGRIAGLLELGAGFNPEFTGRENVYLNAAVLGLSREETARCFPEIAAFAEIGDFLEQPVKFYSSGMVVRLAFAVAVHVRPDILLIDEALAVGDIRFQMKCIDHMRGLQEAGVTILFVSHAVEQIKRFCQTALWLEGGQLVEQGPVSSVADHYFDHLHRQAIPAAPTAESAAPAAPLLVARIVKVEASAAEIHVFGDFRVAVTYEILEESIPGFLLGVAIYDRQRHYIFGPNTSLDGVEVPNTRGVHTVEYLLPRLPLLSGTYFLDVGIFKDRGLVQLDYRLNEKSFTVQAEYFTEGTVHLEHEWRVRSGDHEG